MAFELGDYSIKFSKPNWGTPINVKSDSRKWINMYIEINYDHQVKENLKLSCLGSGPNTLWPYGWNDVNTNDWESSKSLRAIKEGKVANWIMNKVDEILNETEKKGLTL